MEKIINIPTKFELLDEASLKEADASISLNPLFQWAKIVVTDDLPNANKMRIPQEEFDNIIKTGIFAPIKVAEERIQDHKEAMGKPIGTITQLTKETNKVIALAALWKTERPDDISSLKEMYLNGNPPQVSWEIAYSEENVDAEGIRNLKGTILTGLAIVGMPAYSGRTPFIAMSSQNEGDISMEELETLKNKVVDLEKQLADMKTSLDAKTAELTQKDTELSELKNFKASIEKEKTDAERILAIKNKFKEAGVEKDENYFSTNKDTFLKLEDSSIDFMIQELVAFAKTAKSSVDDKTKIPNIEDKTNTNLDDPKELGRALRERNLKK